LVTLYGAVAAVVWLSGYRVAIAVCLVGYVACSLLFMEPRGRIDLDNAREVVGLAAYLFTCGLIIGLGEAMQRAQRRANEGREVMRVTLRSIGDAVITTDLAGRVSSMNDAAESLPGWTAGDARGLPLERVFHIINEISRQVVANPAMRALR